VEVVGTLGGHRRRLLGSETGSQKPLPAPFDDADREVGPLVAGMAGA
jgi:hypothetical protein